MKFASEKKSKRRGLDSAPQLKLCFARFEGAKRMATTAAPYHRPQPSRTIHEVAELAAASERPFTAGQVAQTLNELITLGFIEKFKDEYGITRYRALRGAMGILA
jgi:hypothetical protein